MTRRGFTEDLLNLIKNVYRIIFQSKYTVKEAIKKVEDEIEPTAEVQDILKFFRDSERGIIR